MAEIDNGQRAPSGETSWLIERGQRYERHAYFFLCAGIFVMVSGFGFFVWDKHREPWLIKQLSENHQEQLNKVVGNALEKLNEVVDVLPKIIADNFQRSVPIRLPSEQIPWINPDLPQLPPAEHNVDDPRLQTRNPEARGTNAPDENEALLAEIRKEIDESVQSVYSRSQNMDREFLEQVVEWHQLIIENFEGSQTNLRETQKILSDQFSDRESMLYELQSDLYNIQTSIENARLDQMMQQQDFLVAAMDSPILQSISYLDTAMERGVFVLIIATLSSFFFYHFASLSRRARSYEAIFDAMKLSKSSDKGTTELFVEILKGEEKISSRSNSLLERAIKVVLRREDQKDDQK